MHIQFFGATREVTGSCYLVETAESRLLIDCGMFQGGSFCEAKNHEAFPFDPSTIDAVIVTHAHLDHTGRIPKLVKGGFSGPVFLTPPTFDLMKLVLEDAEKLMRDAQEQKAQPPLYGAEDVEKTLSLCKTKTYSQYESFGDLKFRFRDAGHIFGSSFVEIEENGGARATFSGDVGNEHVPILRETAQLAETDLLVVESTYGNRIHEDESMRSQKLRDIIIRTAQRQGVLVIPAFAIERTQQLLFELNQLIDKGELPRIEVFLDSPMAIKATDVIKKYPEYYDPEARALVAAGEDFFQFKGLTLTPTRDDSKRINAANRPKVIIAGAGMMNGGRILHHLVRYLGDARSTLLIIGYQAEGTLGRRLYEGERKVQVLDERIDVRAEVTSIGAYSAHGDQNKLVKWIGSASKRPAQVLCTHGDEGASVALATRISQELGIASRAPHIGDRVEI